MNSIRIPDSLLRSLICFALFSFATASCSPGPTAPADQAAANSPTYPNSEARSSSSTTHSHSSRHLSTQSVFEIAGSVVVDNESSQSLGQIQISDSNQTLLVDIEADQADTIDLPFNPVSITIASQVCTFPCHQIIQLPDGTEVLVIWENPSLIKIIDYGQQN